MATKKAIKTVLRQIESLMLKRLKADEDVSGEFDDLLEIRDGLIWLCEDDGIPVSTADGCPPQDPDCQDPPNPPPGGGGG